MSVAEETMYIYDLPYLEFKACCNILDENNLWEELSVHMGYERTTIQEVRREIGCGKSPSEKLLSLWGNLNHTVLELFVLLDRMKNIEAMEVLKKFINPNILIKFQLKHCQRKREEDIVEVPQENHIESEKILNVPKQNIDIVSKESNESSPEMNLKLPYLAAPGGNSRLTTVSVRSWNDVKLPIPIIPYDDLQLATNNWDPTTILGKGGFGTVFRGTWKCTQVAIKRIERKEDDRNSYIEQMKQSMTELHCLNAYRHDNILPLYGFSMGGPQPCLVYQYMRGGSLEGRLRDSKSRLKWSTRLSIATGTARGLQFLHTIGDNPLVHGDIKPANILLDKNDFPRIGDFGLAREGPHEEYVHISKVHGTRPYLPDEFLRGKKFSTKVDTFSFGIVLFEITTGLAAYSNRRASKFLRDHVVDYEGDILELKDPREEGGDSCFRGLMNIGKICVSRRAKDRPEMVVVLKELENLVCPDEES
ncbi:serine/threonine-protein kinase pelle [Coccinella septempunctata]|uniref:serine/threonine-protein kinase pelle n=1 Tax=Coccinella septempunctata TaxID=41139 RepID=UPI001D0682B9|nr:serine/threonine-protein kinase pelle [Coccinella septempunctata]XP_044764250.1 serine/threonine-protein kinase pelle [Coccinella septempunctata]